jgi:CHAD domain-containing protein
MVTEHRETERKYETDSPVLTLPPLEDLPRVASVSDPEDEVLEADYYDTADLRLLGARITLRRRRGGHDEGWHLKLPAGQDSRRELGRPLEDGQSGVPPELAELVRAFTRGEPLQPVAHISTARRRRILRDAEGNSLAEVVTDEVSAQTMGASTTISGWQEAEFELTGGDLRLLRAADRRLRRAGLRPAGHAAKLERALADRLPVAQPGRLGAPGQLGAPGPLTKRPTSADVVLGYLREQAETMKRYDPLVRRDEPDAVHQMRVATRRLRSTLQSFGSVLRPDGTEHLRGELRWLAGVLGEARDTEILHQRMRSRLTEIPPELVMGPVAARIQRHFAPLQATAREAVLEALDSDRYTALLDELDRLLADPPLAPAAGRPAASELPEAVARAYRRVSRRMRRAREAPVGREREVALHETRKAAKRARYAAEAVRPVFGSPAGRFAEQQKQLQSLLGDHQDAVITRGSARDLAVRAHLAGENAFPYGLLYEREDADVRQLDDEARRVWAKIKRRKYRRWLG